MGDQAVKVQVQAGNIRTLDANTRSDDGASRGWSARSVIVSVASSGKAERISRLNERLSGNLKGPSTTSR